MAGKKITNKSWRRRRAKLTEQAIRVQGSMTTQSSTSTTTRVQGSSRMRSSTTTRVQGRKAVPHSAEQESGKTSATAKLDPKRCVIYTRTSTKRVQGSSSLHQLSQIAKALAGTTKAKVATKDITTINDSASGMSPDHRQQRLMDIITSGKFQTVFVESTHVLSREARVAEDVATVASKHGVQLIPGDSPVDSPVNSPGRKALMAAVMKFQRDMTHKRMTQGREAMS